MSNRFIPEYPAPLPDVTRLEVIDPDGRAYVEYGVRVRLSFQDDGRTLKAFVSVGSAKGPDPSHDLRSSDASTFDTVCTRCGRTDCVPGGWGDLLLPCPVNVLR